MSLFGSLTNRIFFGSALLAVGSIAIAIYNVNVAVTRQAEQELRRGLDEADTIIEEYRRVLVEHFTREARLIADLPLLKAAVDTNDPTTVQPMADDYQRQLTADLLLVTGRQGQMLAEIASAERRDRLVCVAARRQVGGDRTRVELLLAASGRHPADRRPCPSGSIREQPEILGTLSVGVSLDSGAASRFKSLTNSDIAFGMTGAVRASTLPQELWPALVPLLERSDVWQSVPVGNEDYIAKTRALPTGLSAPADAGRAPAADPPPPERAPASSSCARGPSAWAFSTRSTAGLASSRSSPCSRPRF